MFERMRNIGLAALLALGLAVAACDPVETPIPEDPVPVPETKIEPEAEERGPADVDAERLVAADDEPGNWMSHGRTYSEQRYSPLDTISTENATQLGLAWHMDLDEIRGIEATPIVVDGVMYTTSAWSVVHALDARTGEKLWTYDPEVPKDWGVYACCDVVNRGVAVWKGRVYVGSLDGRLIALDAESGEKVWETNTIDRRQPYTITGAPRIVKGLVLIGNGGAELGVRGYISAYDAMTGKRIWRFHTVPGNPEKGFENDIMEAAADTWTGEWWTYGGGGTVWDSMAYDPELDLLYIGVGNGSPWNQRIRSPQGGDNLFLSSIVALRPETGEYVCHYQTTPGETWDYTATQHIILADLEIDGQPRKVLMQAPKNGFFYVLDRENCDLISADKYVNVTWARNINKLTGRPVEVPEARYADGPTVVHPGPYGGHNWHPMAFNPDTGLVYIPALEIPATYADPEEFAFRPGRWNQGTDPLMAALPDDEAQRKALKPLINGHLSAWDPVAQKEAWRVEYNAPWNGGVLTTAGNLVFQGTADARFVAYDATTGREVWSSPSQTGIVAAPITYEIDGEQYVTVMAGWGGAYALVAGYFVKDESRPPLSRVLTYKLGATEELPELTWQPLEHPEPPELLPDPEIMAEGRSVYHHFCQFCHGDSAAAGGVVMDLRYSAMLHDKKLWKEVVIDGSMSQGGMAGFGTYITEEDAEAVRAYVIRRAHDLAAEREAAAAE
ncbi:MAG: PQQ-dependent dehydrogenase, methanol/ethanol family [Alphaproteobacteria bacterium]